MRWRKSNILLKISPQVTREVFYGLDTVPGTPLQKHGDWCQARHPSRSYKEKNISKCVLTNRLQVVNKWKCNTIERSRNHEKRERGRTRHRSASISFPSTHKAVTHHVHAPARVRPLDLSDVDMCPCTNNTVLFRTGSITWQDLHIMNRGISL